MIYKLMKRIIERSNYNKADMHTKLDVYLAYDRISQEEYKELCDMINTQ